MFNTDSMILFNMLRTVCLCNDNEINIDESVYMHFRLTLHRQKSGIKTWRVAANSKSN